MGSKRSPIDRVLAFYRESSPDVVRVTHALASEIVTERGIGAKAKSNGAGKRVYTKKSKLTNGASASGTDASGGQQ